MQQQQQMSQKLNSIVQKQTEYTWKWCCLLNKFESRRGTVGTWNRSASLTEMDQKGKTTKAKNTKTHFHTIIII